MTTTQHGLIDPTVVVTTNLNRRIEITRSFMMMKRVSGSDAGISAKLTYDEHIRLAQGHLKAALEMEIQAGKEGQVARGEEPGWRWKLEGGEVAEEPEADGWVVDSEELGGPELFESGDYQQACVMADNYAGTVRRVRYGGVVHDARGPQQCEWVGVGYPYEAARCWRNAHDTSQRHVWEASDGLYRWSTPSNEHPSHAIRAAVRDRDEREGQ